MAKVLAKISSLGDLRKAVNSLKSEKGELESVTKFWRNYLQ